METFALKGYLFIMIFYSTADIFSLLQKVFFKHALNFFNLFSQLQLFFYQSLQCQLHIPLIFRIRSAPFFSFL